jgi:hypothetical protein
LEDRRLLSIGPLSGLSVGKLADGQAYEAAVLGESPPTVQEADPVDTYPFVEDFEAGDIGLLGPYWTFETQGTGEVLVTDQDGPRDAYHLELTSSQYDWAAATLHLDLLDGSTPKSGVTLDFWQKVDSSGYQSGRLEIRPDDASSWTSILTLPQPSEYRHYTINLDEEVQNAGIGYTDDFQIRFFQWKNYHYGTFGYYFDDVRVMSSGEDLFGPRVVSHTEPATAPVSSFDVTFDEAIGSFPLDQVSISSPGNNPITPSAVTTTDNVTWTVEFPAQSLSGDYEFRINPGVTDASPWANPMNQDGDAINGETNDWYDGSFTVESEPVTVYPFVEDFEDGDINLLRPSWEFAGHGGYEVRVTDSGGPRDSYHLNSTLTSTYSYSSMILHLDLLDGSTPASGVTLDFWHKASGSGQLPELHVRPDDSASWTKVADLQWASSYTHYTFDLDQEVQDAGVAYSDDFQIRFYQYVSSSYDKDFYLDDVRVMTTGEDLFGPKVVSHTETATAPVTSFDVTFDEPIGSFPLDQVSLTGPASAAWSARPSTCAKGPTRGSW